MIDLIIQWNCVHIATWGSTKKRRNTCRYTRLLSTKSYQLDSNQPLWLPQLFLWFKISSDLGIAQPNFEFSICNGTLSQKIQKWEFQKRTKSGFALFATAIWNWWWKKTKLSISVFTRPWLTKFYQLHSKMSPLPTQLCLSYCSITLVQIKGKSGRESELYVSRSLILHNTKQKLLLNRAA